MVVVAGCSSSWFLFVGFRVWLDLPVLRSCLGLGFGYVVVTSSSSSSWGLSSSWFRGLSGIPTMDVLMP